MSCAVAVVELRLYFEDKLVKATRRTGKRDTTNMQDMNFRFGNATRDQVIMSTAKRDDGVQHAWKMLRAPEALRATLVDAM